MPRPLHSGRVVLLTAFVALTAAAAALASGAAVPVNLRIVGAENVETGDSVSLSASAPLPKGAHLLIQAYHRGVPPKKVVECPRTPCAGSYQSAQEDVVIFQAAVIKRVKGKAVRLGRSKTVTATWVEPVPAQPPAPPPAVAGHYEGTIGNARSFIRFDVSADGFSITNLSTGEIDMSCDPPDYTTWFDNTGGPGPFRIEPDGTFSITGSGSDDSGTWALKTTGTFSGTSASGITRADVSFTYKGQGYGCSSGDQPWTATKVG